jgi:hypothetical protein
MSSRHRAIGGFSGRFMQRALILASALLIFSFASTSHAYPWMLKHGLAKCESCHTDPMGGETLTAFGRVMSDTTLSTRWGETEPSSKAELLFGIPEPRELRVGGSFRYMDALYTFPQNGGSGHYTHFPMQLDAYGQLTLFDRLRISGSLGASRVKVNANQGWAAHVTSNTECPAGTTECRPWNLLSRSHWIGYDVNDDILIRAGRMNLPFGIRMPEHTMWVRNATRTDRESAQDHGVAVDYNHGRWRGQLMGVLGNFQISPDKYRDRGYALYGEYLFQPRLGVGLSSEVLHAEADRYTGLSTTRQAHGLTGRYSPIVPVAILAEADLLFSNQTSAGYVAMLQADYEFVEGVHAMLTGEILDAGRPNSTTDTHKGLGEAKLGGWISLSWFFFTHFDARIDLVAHQEEPLTLLSQIHWYF